MDAKWKIFTHIWLIFMINYINMSFMEHLGNTVDGSEKPADHLGWQGNYLPQLSYWSVGFRDPPINSMSSCGVDWCFFRVSHVSGPIIDLATKQDEQSKLTEHRFQQAEIREKKNVSQMQSDMKAMQKDLEQSFQASLTQNASSLDARLRELKDLLSIQGASKRKSPTNEDDPME